MPSLTFIPPALPQQRDHPPDGPMWRHELKHDGWRLQILKDGSDITLLSKNGHDLTRRFRTVADAARTLKARRLVLDGELIAYGEDGLPSFAALRSPAKDTRHCVWAFDLLQRGKTDLTGQIWRRRRATLARVLPPPVREAAWFELSEDFENGETLLAAAEAMGLEGIVSKRLDAPYVSGPGCGWIKVKTDAWRIANRARFKQFSRG